MRHPGYMLGFVSVAMLSVSCIDEEGCCCNSRAITVTVMDKNYDNVDEIAGQQRRSESLPFASYVTDLVVWRHAEGVDSGETFLPEFGSGDGDVAISASYLLPGSNELVVIGNELLPAQGYDGPVLNRELHPGGDEYFDLYVGSEDIVSPVRGKHTVGMYRAKGKLLVLLESLPSDVVEVGVRIDDVYRSVDRNLVYSGSTAVEKRFSVPQSAGAAELGLCVAPSRAADGLSAVTLGLVRADGRTATLSNIRTSIRRNRISVIKPVYDPDSDGWTLEAFADGRWTWIEDLQIN